MDNQTPDCAVRIAVRERPVRSDHDPTDGIITRGNDEMENVIIVKDQAFIFDHVLGPDVGQSHLYATLIQPMVKKMMAGFHSTVLAYGQTGTGKSYTMGLHSSDFDGESAGMVPRTLEEIFRLTNEAAAASSTTESGTKILISFIEIYNEKAFDLLAENNTEQINTKGTKFVGRTKRAVRSLDDARTILYEGSKNRHVRPTKLNANSSRSHAIFTIYTSVQRGSACTMAAMNLVDLAGSEGVGRTGHEGAARAEGVCINKGLLSISKVLEALSDSNKTTGQYIPYRDSVLTSVLQDSLNLNSYLTLLACVSPLKDDESGTLSTLTFAQRAKSLRHTPQINAFLAEVKKAKTPIKTPSRLLPLRAQNKTNAITPIQRKSNFSTSTAFASKRKASLFPNNTFASPNKICRVNLSSRPHNAINGRYSPNDTQRNTLSNTMINCNSRMLTQRDSIMSHASFMDISSSTVIESAPPPPPPPPTKTPQLPSSFSPYIRLRMEEFEKTLTAKLDKLIETVKEKNRPGNYSARSNTIVDATPLDSSMDVHETILKRFSNFTKKTDSPKIQTSNNLSFNRMKLELTDVLHTELSKAMKKKKVEDDFKMPTITKVLRKKPVKRTRHTLSTTTVKADSDEEEEPCSIQQQPKTVRRSIRLQMRPVSVVAPQSSPHAQRRVSVRRPSCVASDPLQPIVVLSKLKLDDDKLPTKHNRSTVVRGKQKGGLIFDLSKAQSKEQAKAMHKKNILMLLNTGSLSELGKLPQIGVKSAQQIVTYRSMNSPFKNLESLGKKLMTRGKTFERFLQANNLI